MQAVMVDAGRVDAGLEELSLEVCLGLLRVTAVGRIAVIVDEFPIVLPVNYRLVETSGRTWLAVRARPGNVLDRASMHAAFEIDGIDPVHQQGWSVLVRGTLQHVDPKPPISAPASIPNRGSRRSGMHGS